MAAPLKPWEKAQEGGALHNQARGGVADSTTQLRGAAGPAASLANGEIQGAGRPPIPPRPTGSSAPYGSSYGYGTGLGGYSGIGGYGGMGGIGGMYPTSYMGGGYGMGYSPYNRMGTFNTDNSNSFVQQAEASASGAFQSVESVVSAFSSISMMLESTYFALHNSFRAVLGVADQFSRLKLQLTNVAASFAVFKFIRWLYRRTQVLLGLRKAGLSEDAWANAVAKSATEAQERFPGQQKSSWPFVVFVGLTIFLIKKILNSVSGHHSNTGNGASWTDGTGDHVVGECKYQFTADRQDELSVTQGQRIFLAPAELQPRLRENDWLLASDGVKKGAVPATYIRILGKCKGIPKVKTEGTATSTSDSPASSSKPVVEVSKPVAEESTQH